MSTSTHALTLQNPIQAPQVTKELSENVILTCLDDIYNWARLSTLYPMMFGTAC
jgi:NAD(P)H-quinone oxidoreductase subunit K